MKKKALAKKVVTHKAVKRTDLRTSSSSGAQTVLFRRAIIISACLVLVILVASLPKGTASQAVAGVSIMRGLFEQATIPLPSNPHAASYNIYYGQSGEQSFTNSVRNIPPKVTNYTISYLKKGVTYKYSIATVVNGKEVSFTPVKTLIGLQPM